MVGLMVFKKVHKRTKLTKQKACDQSTLTVKATAGLRKSHQQSRAAVSVHCAILCALLSNVLLLMKPFCKLMKHYI